jgi:hypothetical protein
LRLKELVVVSCQGIWNEPGSPVTRNLIQAKGGHG